MGKIMQLIQKIPPQRCSKENHSENMQHIYRRTSIPTCDFSKAAKQLD